VTSGELVTLTAEERHLVFALRDIPPSALRDTLTSLICDLVDAVAHPSCAEMQADGVPCPSAEVSCDECRRLTEVLDGLRQRLPVG
jgi:hypothetical protein